MLEPEMLREIGPELSLRNSGITPLVSVIIPVFNAHNSINMCINSVISQTLKDIEIICIDDGSTDGSVSAIEHFINIDSRVTLIRHDRNKGPGGARNTGIAAARAPYVASVDSDDTMQPDMLETLLNAFECGEYDIVCCGFRVISPDGQLISTNNFPDSIINIDCNTNIFNTINPAFWNKLWKKSTFTENLILFPEDVYFQDACVTPRVVSKSRKIRVVNDVLYNYVKRQNSITQSFSDKHMHDYQHLFESWISLLKENNTLEMNAHNLYNAISSQLNYHAANAARTLADEQRKSDYIRKLSVLKAGYLVGHRAILGSAAGRVLEAFLALDDSGKRLTENEKQVSALPAIDEKCSRPRVYGQRIVVDGHSYVREGATAAAISRLLSALATRFPRLARISVRLLRSAWRAGRQIAVVTRREPRQEADARIFVREGDVRGEKLLAANGNLNPVSLALWHYVLQQPGDWTHVVDVGANYGEMLVHGGLPSEAVIIALEPNPAVAACLRRTLSASGVNAVVIEAAATDHDGEAEILIDTVWSGTSRLASVGAAADATEARRFQPLVTPCRTLDQVLREAGAAPESRVLVKIDVEGAERSVLAGSMVTANMVRTWRAIVEVLHMNDADFDWMCSGYRVWAWGLKQPRLLPVASAAEFRRLTAEGVCYAQDVAIERIRTPAL